MPIYEVIFDLNIKELKHTTLQHQTTAPSFWNDQIAAQKTLQEIKSLELWISLWNNLNQKANSLEELILLAQSENEESLYNEIIKEIEALDKAIEDVEFKNMLSGKDDERNCILTIHSGAGGTESQDWAEMLMRMYLRWGEQNSYKMNLVEMTDGDGAGIKSATLHI